ncbi:MAG: tetratricopeptide repeat protein, partial [Pseudomonadota bacterium]
MTLRLTFRRTAVASAILLVAFGVAGCNSSEERAEEHYKRGIEFVENGDLVKASLELRNALKLDQSRTDALYSLGEVEEKRGNIEAAYRIYVSVAEQVEDHLPVRLKLVYLLLSAQQIDLAKKYADQVKNFDTTNPAALVALATLELKSGNLGEAAELAQYALEEKPDYVDALILLASERMAAKRPEEALEFLERAPEASERNIGLQVLRLSVLEAMDEQLGVEKLFGKLVELFPENPAMYQAWAKWYLSKQRSSDAEKVLRQYAKSSPNEATAQLSLVSFLNAQKGSVAAIAELEKISKKWIERGANPFRLNVAL